MNEESLPATNPIPSHSILVAEDDAHVRYLNTKLLISSGYHVDVAEDGAVAWETLQTKSYHLLITDYDMPKMSGIELVQKLRAARMAVPVILVSGTMPLDELKAHPDLQINAMLPKPFDVKDLLKTVKEILDATGAAPKPAVIKATA